MVSMGKLLPQSVWTKLRESVSDKNASYRLKWHQIERLLKVHRGVHNAILHQYSKFGEQNHDAADWVVILGEEYGEVCRAVYEGNTDHAVLELLQVAAVAMAAVEQVMREKERRKNEQIKKAQSNNRNDGQQKREAGQAQSKPKGAQDQQGVSKEGETTKAQEGSK